MKKRFVLAVALLGLSAIPAASQDAEALYQGGCDDGEASACSVLALMFETGEGMPRDLERAAGLYGRACTLGNMEGCTILGDMFQAGQGVARDLARSVSLYEQACEGGDLLGCESLGLLYEAGLGVLGDETRAVRLYRQACDGSQWTACNRLGMLVQTGAGVPANPDVAVELFAMACDAGVARGCVNLGVNYQRGEGVQPDPVLAFALYQAGCNAGDLLGCVNLGSLHRTGTGTGAPADPRLAASFYRRACDGGESMGCFNLGTSYEQGQGVPQDIVTAVASFQRACALGLEIGCRRLPTRALAQAQPLDSSIIATGGRVTDAETDEPIEGAIVDMPELGIRLVSDRQGHVDLPDLPVGRHLIKSEAAGYSVTEGYLRVPGEADFIIKLEHALVADANAPGRILGRVTDETGQRGLSNVDISVMNRIAGRTSSNPQGRFGLTGLRPGLVEIRFQALGYETRTASVIIQPGLTIDVVATMSTDPIRLAPIQVVAVRSRALERNGYYDRSRLHYGTQLGPADIEKLNTGRLADIFWYAPGVSVEGTGDVGLPVRIVTHRRQGATEAACGLDMYLDNIRTEGLDINEIPIGQVEAIEIYQGLDTPAQYQRQSSVRCGVVLIWTKRGA